MNTHAAQEKIQAVRNARSADALSDGTALQISWRRATGDGMAHRYQTYKAMAGGYELTIPDVTILRPQKLTMYKVNQKYRSGPR